MQKAAAATDEDTARMRIKASYSQRMLIQMLWVILAIVAPCFHFVAGIVPLLFPDVYKRQELAKNGVLAGLLETGAVVKTAFCGPCFGAGDTPANNAFSIRHTTRNFRCV